CACWCRWFSSPKIGESDPKRSFDARLAWPVVCLDVGAPRIGNERDSDATVIDRVGPIELDVLGFERLDERFEVLHVEAYVVEDAAFRARLRCVGLGEPKLNARQIRNRRVVAYARLGAEDAAVPRLALRDRRLRQEEVNGLAWDWHRLRLVLQYLDGQAVGRVDDRLIPPAIVSGRYRHAGGLPLGDLFLDVIDNEADVIHHRTFGRAGRRGCSRCLVENNH